MSLRLTEEQFEHLEALSKVHGMNKTRLLSTMIETEYDAINGNPKMKEALELMQKMNDFIKGIGETKDKDDSV